MKWWLAICLVSCLMAWAANAQITKTATFENFTAGQSFKPSFADPLSGVTFDDSTSAAGGFSIDYSTDRDTKYLTAGGGPTNVYGVNFGFSATLPNLANSVSLDVSYFGGNTSLVSVTAFDASGSAIGQRFGPANARNPFTLQITSGQFNINSLQIQVPAGLAAGYDNLGFTIIPEPTSLPLLLSAAAIALQRRGR